MVEPKIRFKGFEGEWRKIKFVEHILSIQTGTNLLGNLQNNGTPLLKMGNLQRGFFILDKLEYLDEQTKIEPQNMVYYGDFFFNTRNTLDLVGKGATWTGESGKFAFNSNIARFNFKNINTIFYNYLYNTPKVLLQVRARAMGTTSVAAIYPNSLNSITYYLPYKAEQQQIASYFKSLDILIQSTTKKIASLKQLKSASLISMFPQVGETKPRVRFKGFEEDWKTVPFDIVFRYLKSNTLSRADLNETLGSARNIHYGDILIKFGTLIDIRKDDLPYITNHFLANQLINNCKLQKGDIVFADAAEDSTVGKCTEIAFIGEEKVVAGLHTIPCRTLFEFSEGYLGFYLNSPSYHNQLLPLMQGTKISSISKSALLNTSISFPTSIAEQRQIASFFRSLDTQISLETQRLDKLKQIKSACLDKMFV